MTTPINIPAVQASVMKRAYAAGLRQFQGAEVPTARRSRVIGAGPAGLGAASVLAQTRLQGHGVRAAEAAGRDDAISSRISGSTRRSRAETSNSSRASGAIEFKWARRSPIRRRCWRRIKAVIVSAGLEEPMRLDIPGEEYALSWQAYLENQKQIQVTGKKVAVLGGGAVAADCATTAKRRGALSVEMVYRRKQENMPLTAYERDMLIEHGIEISSCSKPLAITHKGKKVTGLRIARMTLPKGKAPRPGELRRQQEGVARLPGVRRGGLRHWQPAQDAAQEGQRHFLRGRHGPRLRDRGGSGGHREERRAGGRRVPPRREAAPIQEPRQEPRDAGGHESLPGAAGGRVLRPQDRSPFLLSAAPHTDGYAQMRKAYERGWSGGVMKTAFDNVPIHIPAEYMAVFGPSTYGNCDNVSGHPLDRVCKEVEQLIKEFPDRLTLASTGGPVTGRDEADKAVWQSNTRKLESAGAMGVEYSLSCPQGGDGTDGDVVSQNAELAAKIIDWVMEASSDDNPKLFKLTAAVTSIQPDHQADSGGLCEVSRTSRAASPWRTASPRWSCARRRTGAGRKAS